VINVFGRCKRCGIEDILDEDGMCEICRAEGRGMRWRCFHCLRFYEEKPSECPHCGCPHFTAIEKCRGEDQAIEISARESSHVSESDAKVIATLETKRIQDIFTQ